MTVVLISGVSRGLGLGMLKLYALRPGYTVIGTTLSDTPLEGIETAEGTRVITVQMDVRDVESPKRAVEKLRTEYGISKVDIAISNAGILSDKSWCPVKDIDPQDFENHWRVNVKGMLLFFQAVLPFLQPGAKFIFMSSGIATLDQVPDKTIVTYGISKVGATYLGRYTHFEHPDLIIFPMAPGHVGTDMGIYTAAKMGIKEAPVTMEQSTTGMAKVIDEATRETHGGQIYLYNGQKRTW